MWLADVSFGLYCQPLALGFIHCLFSLMNLKQNLWSWGIVNFPVFQKEPRNQQESVLLKCRMGDCLPHLTRETEVSSFNRVVCSCSYKMRAIWMKEQNVFIYIGLSEYYSECSQRRKSEMRAGSDLQLSCKNGQRQRDPVEENEKENSTLSYEQSKNFFSHDSFLFEVPYLNFMKMLQNHFFLLT